MNICEMHKLILYGDGSSQFEGHSGVDNCQGGEPDTGEFQFSFMNVC